MATDRTDAQIDGPRPKRTAENVTARMKIIARLVISKLPGHGPASRPQNAITAEAPR